MITPSPLHIQRIDPPEFGSIDWGQEVGGEQYEWGHQIPALYRILADPNGVNTFVRNPQPGDDHLVAVGYWAPLVHLMLYSFGWLRPDRGMDRWMNAGTPVDDLRFQVIQDLWDSGRQLDWFVAWLTSHPGLGHEALGRWSTVRNDDSVDEARRRWARRVTESTATSNVHNPLVGGTDPLHLSAHCSGPVDSESTNDNRPVVACVRGDREATIVLDSMVGWYRHLAELDLPNIGNRSWRVEVYARPVGYLGTYRRSRATGLWFSGQHRYHSMGI